MEQKKYMRGRRNIGEERKRRMKARIQKKGWKEKDMERENRKEKQNKQGERKRKKRRRERRN